MTKDEALKLAIDALDSDDPSLQLRVAITLRGELAQPAEGMVSVPEEPTGAMMVAGTSCIPIQDANMVRRCYKAMIAARPK